ncbi:putative SMAD FHA domain-containing protein [Lyophyllum shimeji]|uniref:SMAD FHA domain-containing protein n=1 Tax=Lyophyllum shimeji TaxID=47721 RepID=A0A9P3PLI7_LYOSH|nr:putative SMAD FHA domain-containing protein [Lyophyllum shimeji]
MPRDSLSPPRNRPRYQGSSRDYSETIEYSERRGNGYGRERRGYQERDLTWRDEEVSRGSRRESYREYSEKERERERARDRERYDSGRDRYRDRESDYSTRAGPSSRRSASPRRRSSRPESERGSASQSPRPVDKAKPNFKPSGLLAAETNTVKTADGTTTVLKYNEPPEARKPTVGWRLYVFKGSEQVELLHIHRQSAYLIGRDRLVADISVDHPSCSKQHAVIQYRHIQQKNEFGDTKSLTKPFIIDLESTNGTLVNDETIPAARYYELKAGDVIKFGQSTREYVLLHDEAT